MLQVLACVAGTLLVSQVLACVAGTCLCYRYLLVLQVCLRGKYLLVLQVLACVTGTSHSIQLDPHM